MFVLVTVLVLAVGCGQKQETGDGQSTQASQDFFEQTLKTCQEYAFLHWRTEKLLTEASDYPDYNSWKHDMEKLKTDWMGFKSRASQLESRSSYYLGEPVSWKGMPVAHAITYGEITDIFDKARAGHKIETLSKHLGVDAQQAYDLLDQAQNFARAEAWHGAGDTFQKLETSAVVIKDGCKVTGFVGGVVLSGGAAGLAGASAATKAAVVVSGADLALEVTEDGANIAYGNNNKVSEFVGDARKFTEPAATILTITTLPENMASNYDKFSAVMVAADQFRSSAQEGKIVGVSLPVAGDNKEGKIESAVMDQEELDDWLSNLGHKQEEHSLEELMEEVARDLEKEEEFQKVISKKTKAENEKGEQAEDASEKEANQDDENSSDQVDGQEAEALPEDKVSATDNEGVVTAVFESPKEKTFLKGQARMWSVEVNGLDKVGGEPENDILAQLGNGVRSQCHFTFYIDGVKYKEKRDNKTCGFTSTFINKTGSLRAKVEVEVYKETAEYDDEMNYLGKKKEVLDTMTLIRNYRVVAPEIE